MVRRDLGPDAAVLHTREVRTAGFFGWLTGPRQIEVTASASVNVPSRLPGRTAGEERGRPQRRRSLPPPPACSRRRRRD